MEEAGPDLGFKGQIRTGERRQQLWTRNLPGLPHKSPRTGQTWGRAGVPQRDKTIRRLFQPESWVCRRPLEIKLERKDG